MNTIRINGQEWAIVPVEAYEGMLRAAGKEAGPEWTDASVYRVMLAAAPPLPASTMEALQAAVDGTADLEEATMSAMSKILTDTANVLKGDPGPLSSHSWHDLAAIAAALKQTSEKWRQLTHQYDAERIRLKAELAEARKGALEEAAKLCDAMVDEPGGSSEGYESVCAARIRDLAAQETKPQKLDNAA